MVRLTLPKDKFIVAYESSDVSVATISSNGIVKLISAGERVGAPCIDCVKITTSANLTWSPKTENRGNTDLD